MTEDFPNIRYGLIGHPVQGSGSPALFRAAYNGTWTYDLIDEEIAAYQEGEHEGVHTPPVVLIAPSWNPGNILDSCIDEMIGVLLEHGYRIVVRPHPEYTKRFRPKWEALIARHAETPEERLYFEKDFSSNSSILESDTIITDWSTVNLEFSFTTLKPSIFIDTPMKVNNPDWEELGIVPTDISIRNEIGRSLAPEALAELPDIIGDMLERGEEWADEISAVRARMIANPRFQRWALDLAEELGVPVQEAVRTGGATNGACHGLMRLSRVSNRLSGSTGLLRWALRPACRLRCTSSSKALAVSAMMGISRASCRSIARMVRVASRPSISGILTSIRIAS